MTGDDHSIWDTYSGVPIFETDLYEPDRITSTMTGRKPSSRKSPLPWVKYVMIVLGDLARVIRDHVPLAW